MVGMASRGMSYWLFYLKGLDKSQTFVDRFFAQLIVISVIKEFAGVIVWPIPLTVSKTLIKCAAGLSLALLK